MLVSGPALGFALGWILGGDPRRLRDLHVRWLPLLAVGVALRLAAGAAGEAAAVLYVIGFAAVATVAAGNARLPGLPLIAVGAALNLLVVVANGGMPVDPAAISAAGARMPGPGDALHVGLSGSTALAFLADVIPVAPVRGVYSVGDVLLSAGGFWLPLRWMRGR